MGSAAAIAMLQKNIRRHSGCSVSLLQTCRHLSDGRLAEVTEHRKSKMHRGVPSLGRSLQNGNRGQELSRDPPPQALATTRHSTQHAPASMTKTRFTAADVRAMVRDLRSSVLGLRVVNVYDLDAKVGFSLDCQVFANAVMCSLLSSVLKPGRYRPLGILSAVCAGR